MLRSTRSSTASRSSAFSAAARRSAMRVASASRSDSAVDAISRHSSARFRTEARLSRADANARPGSSCPANRHSSSSKSLKPEDGPGLTPDFRASSARRLDSAYRRGRPMPAVRRFPATCSSTCSSSSRLSARSDALTIKNILSSSKLSLIRPSCISSPLSALENAWL
ncbi:hypothetical protein D3C71_1561340 [compost metagenome]